MQCVDIERDPSDQVLTGLGTAPSTTRRHGGNFTRRAFGAAYSAGFAA
jgi:hypothetical protein